MIGRFDATIELDAARRFDSIMYFNFFFNAGHLLGRYVDYFHSFASVDFRICFLDFRYVPRFANTAVLTLAKEFILEDYVILDDSGIGIIFA